METLDVDEKANRLLQYAEDWNRVPAKADRDRLMEEYGFDMYEFWQGIKQGQNKNVYHSKLSSNPVLKDFETLVAKKEK